MTVYFELVTNSVTNRAVFGVSDLKVYPVGCRSCLNYPFTYKIDYNYDEALNLLVSFNRVYRESPDNFRQIFLLKVNGKQLDYAVEASSGVTYHLRAFPPETLDGVVTLECLFPENVTTNVNDPVNGVQPFFARLLAGSYFSKKVVDNLSLIHI